MRNHLVSIALVATTVVLGCGGGVPQDNELGESAETAQPPTATGAVETDPDDPTLIMRPFTAEQIRAEWVSGLRLLVRRTYPEETRIERWTVIAADDWGADIEYTTIADDGSVMGEPTLSRSTWIALRDHASFPAAHSTREWVARTTQLGEFEGWLYRVANEGAATVQEFFFVPELPGAPVQLRVFEGDAMIFEFEQTARLRPANG